MAMSFRSQARFTQTGKRKRETLLAGRKMCIGFLALGSYFVEKSSVHVYLCFCQQEGNDWFLRLLLPHCSSRRELNLHSANSEGPSIQTLTAQREIPAMFDQ